MRQIYNLKKIGLLEQGSIINACIARDYKEIESFGIVITPRCDIENSKVNSIHYLPIVNLEEWIKQDFCKLFAYRAKNEIKNKLKAVFDRYKLSTSLIDMFTKEQLLEKLKTVLNKKVDYKSVEENLEKLEICNKDEPKCTLTEIKILATEYAKISKTIFKELKENKFKDYYLLESWNSENEYYVVLMREIGSIDFNLALRISKGLLGREITEIEKLSNDISVKNQDCFIYTIATLKSPFIEHLIQQFFLNFGRIGIQDHLNGIENDFHTLLTTLK